MEGIDLFVKILFFVKILSQYKKEGRRMNFRSLEVREASSSHLKINLLFLFTGMKIYTLPFKLPEIGSVLGGLLELRGSHISLACFHGINFKSKSWALFSLKDPSISFVSDAQEILDETTDINKKIRNTTVIQTLSFSLGQSDQVCNSNYTKITLVAD